MHLDNARKLDKFFIQLCAHFRNLFYNLTCQSLLENARVSRAVEDVQQFQCQNVLELEL